MEDNELIQLVNSVDIQETLLFNKKVKILGIRKTIIIIYIIDTFVNIVLFSIINPYYLFSLSTSLFVVYGLLSFNIACTKFQLYNLISVFIFKSILLFTNISISIKICLAISLLLLIFFFKLVTKFYFFITNKITETELDSLQSGWQPRNIPFAL